MSTTRLLLVAVGLLGGTGRSSMTSAYREADAATIASFEYVSDALGPRFQLSDLR